MKYWSEIVKATLYKLGIEENDEDSTEYTDKMPIIANECLSTIANDIRACIKRINIVTDSKNNEVIMPDDFLAFSGLAIMFRNKNEIVYHPDVYYTDWNSLILPDKGVYTISYNAKYGEIPNSIIQKNMEAYNTFDLTKSYTGTQFKNVFGIGVDSEDIVFNGISSSVLECLPTYIASQLLLQDDAQKSTMLRNEFEVLVQRLENNIMFQNESFVSKGGWF